MWCVDPGATLVTACLHFVVFGWSRLMPGGLIVVTFGKSPVASSLLLHNFCVEVCNREKCSRLQFLDLREESGQHVLDYTAV